MQNCIAFVTHVLNPAICKAFERLSNEAPADHDVLLLLSSDDPMPDIASALADRVVLISREDLWRLGYKEKCRQSDWGMDGNADLLFLEIHRRLPQYDPFWFVEYDVHWEGRWSTLFEHFRPSGAAVLGASMHPIASMPHKLDTLNYPPLVIPEAFGWAPLDMIKGFLPICRLNRAALDALDAAYRAGLGGHYEITVPSVAAASGLAVEDIGGRGPFVRPDNQDRFYFANSSSSSHSPGTFVFRPAPKVLRRPNTLWHPVKPAGVPIWHSMRDRGGLLKNLLEALKPIAWRAIIQLWFATRWRPLKTSRQP